MFSDDVLSTFVMMIGALFVGSTLPVGELAFDNNGGDPLEALYDVFDYEIADD